MTRIQNGILYFNHKPTIVLSADYPYYRDFPENWEDRILKLKQAGMNVITFYVPWRHHHLRTDAGDVLDFTGKTQGNRNVLEFLRLIHQHGLSAIVKPGPFIHAETTFGGLPDFVAGDILGEAMLDNEGKPRLWGKVLPAPFDANFQASVEAWFRAVDEQVIRPFAGEDGPIIALQILNEGLYSDGQHPVLAYDYSKSGLTYHANRLQNEYGSVGEYQTRTETAIAAFSDAWVPRSYNIPSLSRVKELIPYLDWAKTQNAYLGELYERWGSLLEASLPILININPPWNEVKGFDHWLTRIVPEAWNVHYGFTNWIGVVSHDETAFLRYLLLVKRSRGINMEENWGFSKLYDWRYRFHHIPFYQTVLALGLGATGFNVYTGVNTSGWTNDLDTFCERPYPDCSPVSESGETGEKYEALRVLSGFLKENEALLLEGRRANEVTWGLYPPYSYLSAFAAEDREYGALGVHAPHSGHQGLESFMLTMLKSKREFGMVNIETASVEELAQERALTLVGGFFLSDEVADKLISYVAQGGTLFWFGQIPKYNERMDLSERMRSLLGEANKYIRLPHGDGHVVYYPENPFSSCGISPTFQHLVDLEFGAPGLRTDAEGYVFSYELGGQTALYVMSTSQIAQRHTVTWAIPSGEERSLAVDLPAKGCAIVVVDEKAIHSCVIKGINDYDESYAIPYAAYGETVLQATVPCDFSYVGGHQTTVNHRD